MLGLGALAWGLFFTATGAVMLHTGFANDTVGPDGELAGKIVGFTFLAMGAPRTRSGASTGALAPAAGGSGTSAASVPSDAISKIERLQKLRESGAITAAEFDREKSKVLAGQ
ncbi:hypothetical protein BH20ACT15_BH20ACT15_12530 [soil metagenome]